MLEWFEGLKGGAPTVVGAIIGSGLGFITLVLGALFNARLNRIRDDNLRKAETRTVAAAMRAELGSVHDTLTYNAKRLLDDPPTGSESFWMPDPSHSVRTFPGLADKIGLLDDPSIIIEIIQAYIVIDQYYENCLVLGGEPRPQMPNNRRLVLMPANRAKNVAAMNTEIAARVQTAMLLLDKYLY